jgi:lysophospholipase L1-like esterase
MNQCTAKIVYPDMRTILAISISMLLMLASSCIKDKPADGVRTYTYTPPTPPVVAPTDTNAAKLYLALGDSYTIGQSVPVADRFPVQTAKYLTDQGVKFDAPEIIAQTGWTTANLIGSLDVAAPSKPAYDIVTLLIGVNNQYQHRTQKEYADQFLLLLNRALMYAGYNKKRVIVLSIPDYGVTPYASGSDRALIAKEIDSFNLINKAIAIQSGVNYLDITPTSRLAADDKTLIATDGLHPSGLQYKLWAEGLVPIIKTVLK